MYVHSWFFNNGNETAGVNRALEQAIFRRLGRNSEQGPKIPPRVDYVQTTATRKVTFWFVLLLAWFSMVTCSDVWEVTTKPVTFIWRWVIIPRSCGSSIMQQTVVLRSQVRLWHFSSIRRASGSLMGCHLDWYFAFVRGDRGRKYENDYRYINKMEIYFVLVSFNSSSLCVFFNKH